MTHPSTVADTLDAGHTPGPWAVSKKKQRRVTANGVSICNAILRNQGGPKHKSFMKDEHEAEANACLIAAAPDMLAALTMLVADFADYPASERPCLAFDLARAAIAKARGEVQP